VVDHGVTLGNYYLTPWIRWYRRPVRPAAIAVTLGRPTTTRDDRAVTLAPAPAGYTAVAPLAPGHWRVETAATAADGTAFRQSRDIFVRP
jgi:nitrogen fixation protein FixH